MPDFGVVPEGFVRKRLVDIKDDLISELSSVTDPGTGEQLTPSLADENDPLILLVNGFSDLMAVAWEQLELAYNQFDPLKATGAGLSGTVQLNAIRRKPGTFSTVVLTLAGTAGRYVPAGKKVSTADDKVTFILPEFVFDGAGAASVVAVASEKGPLIALASSVVKILTPVSGWDLVTNPADATVGTYEETDSQLRRRQRDSTANTARSIIDSIYSSISNLPGVVFCMVRQNITLFEAGGLPAKSIAAVVVGGDSETIGQELFSRVGSGTETFGTTTITITDTQGIEYPVKFSRPIEVAIHVVMQVSVINAFVWGGDGENKIKAAILAYASQGAAALGIPTGFNQDGYITGQSVYASELYIPVNSVQGIRILSLFVGSASPATEEDVQIAWNELAVFASDNITVEVI